LRSSSPFPKGFDGAGADSDIRKLKTASSGELTRASVKVTWKHLPEEASNVWAVLEQASRGGQAASSQPDDEGTASVTARGSIKRGAPVDVSTYVTDAAGNQLGEKRSKSLPVP
jgi:hypothetical protein